MASALSLPRVQVSGAKQAGDVFSDALQSDMTIFTSDVAQRILLGVGGGDGSSSASVVLDDVALHLHRDLLSTADVAAARFLVPDGEGGLKEFSSGRDFATAGKLLVGDGSNAYLSPAGLTWEDTDGGRLDVAGEVKAHKMFTDEGELIARQYVEIQDEVVAIATGLGSSTYAVTSRGSVYAWGDNSAGQLGDGTLTDSSVHVRVSANSSLRQKVVVFVSAGEKHAVALASDGTLHSWGHNTSGQLGNGTNTSSTKPVAVSVTGTSLENKTVVAVTAGALHTVALASDGTLHAWGNNEFGQLGDGTTTDRSFAVLVQTTGTSLEGKTVESITAGANFTTVLVSDGTVHAWGVNGGGQLGNDNVNSSTHLRGLHGGGNVLSRLRTLDCHITSTNLWAQVTRTRSRMSDWCPHLVSLSCDSIGSCAFDFASLSGLTALTSIELTNIRRVSSPEVLAALVGVTNLRVWLRKYTHVPFSCITSLKSLTSLSLCRVYDDSTALKQLRSLTNLEKLYIGDPIDPSLQFVMPLPTLEPLTKLRELTYKMTIPHARLLRSVTPWATVFVAALESLPQLRALRLDVCADGIVGIPDSPIRIDLSRHKSLEDVSIKWGAGPVCLKMKHTA